MALFIPHSAMTRAEAERISSVWNHFISTKTSGPVNGEVQDALAGSAELTRSDVRVNKFHAMSLFRDTGADPPSFDADARRVYSGRELVSMLLRETPVNYARGATFHRDEYKDFVAYDPSETRARIELGTVLEGVLDKAAVGEKATDGVFHRVAREYGPRRALDVVYAYQQLALQYLMYRGFTVSMEDLTVSGAARENIQRIVAELRLKADEVTARLVRGEIVAPINMTTHEFYEKLQQQAQKANDREVLRWVLGSIRPRTNGLFLMVAYGSKGNNGNMVNIMAIVNAVTINGERIREQFSFRRTLPYFPRFATDPAAYGFVAHSYMAGLTASEYICSAMNGRFDLISKALSTSVTGYFMRKGVMSNQSIIVDNFRRCVKDTRVVQFLYGEDGLDARHVESVEFRTVRPATAAVRAMCGIDASAAAGSPAEVAALREAVDGAVGAVLADRDEFRRVFMRVERCNVRRPMRTTMLLPVNVARVVDGVFIRRGKGAPEDKVSAPSLTARIQRVRAFCDAFPYLLINEIQERRRTRVPLHLTAATALMTMLVRAELSPAVLARLTDAELTFVIDRVRLGYQAALVSYGTAAGILACQAVSEPLTQYMLDSHHRSVTGGTTKAGLIRVNEIYGARPQEDEQSPAMLLPVRAEFEADRAAVQEIANGIEYVTVGRFVAEHAILHEAIDRLRYPPYAADAAWIAEFHRHHPLIDAPPDLTKWCVRLVLDRSMMVLKSVSLETIVERLRAQQPHLHVVHTAESVRAIVIRAFVRASYFRRSEDPARVHALLDDILASQVRGIRGILTATVEKDERTVVGDDGALTRKPIFVIATVGSNLFEVMLNPNLNHAEVISNSVGDTLKMFGIESARSKIMSETRSFMEGNTPNLRHLMQYSDEMTKDARVTSVERGGVAAREPRNIMLKMSFAAPVQVLTDASINCTVGDVYGIAAPLMFGAIPKIGTRFNEFVVDEDFVKENAISVDSVLDSL
ncbi:MAG: hypothetical protein KGL39_09445 [Patescibacteria group bacterium]|nr:hypothetical protein [Patescibacteria group bacterium]